MSRKRYKYVSCLEMVESMREMITNKSLFEAWEFAGTTPERSINWPGLSNLYVEESYGDSSDHCNM
jgi:hypothetical protein